MTTHDSAIKTTQWFNSRFEKKDSAFPDLCIYQCVIQDQDLCKQVTDMHHVMSVVQEVVNSIRDRRVHHLLHDVDVHCGDLIVHMEFRCAE